MMRGRKKTGYVVLTLAMLSATMLMAARAATPATGGSPTEREGVAADPMVLLGRYLVITHACGGCHGGNEDDPSAPAEIVGQPPPDAQSIKRTSPMTPGAQPCNPPHTRTLTPETETGLGR